ncbi:AlpA family phage regulatory protein [Hyphomicrobium sp. CS1BSMeth3]|uniref:helix-turn-helix transcriptional regulator n=1 Tax=Hyphomicrobium sp. CS1BSMeth3 TaxID=1892844 RepID=UPI0009FB8085|nr:AlpA family phage regulatory protein [Hyphomicrobium sp. CS1BSMeth3]
MAKNEPDQPASSLSEQPRTGGAKLVGTVSGFRRRFKRIVRRHELRLIVPLADTTIYEMEQRGEFPRRIYLTPRCAGWDLDEVEAWIEERRRASDTGLPKPCVSPDVRKRKVRPVRP